MAVFRWRKHAGWFEEGKVAQAGRTVGEGGEMNVPEDFPTSGGR